MADFMSGLMGLFAPQGDGLGELLNDEQRKKIGQQALMTTAMKLLASGGRSTQPVSLGQALGGAYLSGQEAMNTGVTNAAQNLLLKGKIDEAKAAEALRKKRAEIMGAPYQTQQPITGQQAIASPGGLGPTVEKAALIGQPSKPVASMQSQMADRFRALAAADPDKASEYLTAAEKLSPSEEWSTSAQSGVLNGRPVNYVMSKQGGMKVLDVAPSPNEDKIDAGNEWIIRNKDTGKEIQRIPKQMTPGEVASNKVALGNLAVSQGQLGVAQGNQAMRLQELNRPTQVVNADAGGVISIPQQPISLPGGVVGGGGVTQRPAAPLSQQQQTLVQPRLPQAAPPKLGTPTPTAAQAAMQPSLFKIPGMEKDPTEGQGAAVAYGIRLASAHDTLKELEGKTGGEGTGKIRGTISGAVGILPLVGDKLGSATDSIFNALPTVMGGLNPEQQKALQARVEFITAILRRESGASISVGEFANAEKQYFPQPGDSPEVIKQKQEARERTIEGVRFQAGRFGSRIPTAKSSNFSVSNW